jgi:hypothetical protein
MCVYVCCARFLYLPVLSGSESGKEGDFTFRAYPLTDDKDFTNFFHPDKDSILQLVGATSLCRPWASLPSGMSGGCEHQRVHDVIAGHVRSSQVMIMSGRRSRHATYRCCMQLAHVGMVSLSVGMLVSNSLSFPLPLPG